MLIGFLNYTFFAAEFSGVQITLTQMLIIIFLSVQFAAMSSSIGTGFIAILSLLLTQLDLSLDAIGIIVASDIFIVNFSGVISLVIRDCNLFDLSHKIKID